MNQPRLAQTLVLALAALPALAHVVRADDIDIRTVDYLDVVETSDGSVWKGVIVEQQPNVQYKLATSDGSLHVIKAADVVKITKQRNPWRTAAAAPSAGGIGGGGGAPSAGGVEAHASVGPTLPAPFAVSGLRAEANLAIAFPTGDVNGFSTSFAPDVRIGYEHLFGNFGLEGGGQLRWINWLFPTDASTANDTMWTAQVEAYGRAALHLARVAPYLGLGLGVDVNYVYSTPVNLSKTTPGFGMDLQLGVPVAVTPVLALELGGDYHPGTDSIVDGASKSVSYFALRLGATARF